MLKVNNKKVIQDLAKTTYKANKKRNLGSSSINVGRFI